MERIVCLAAVGDRVSQMVDDVAELEDGARPAVRHQLLTPYGRELEPIVLSLGMWGSRTRDLDAPGEPRPDLAILFLARRLSGLAGPLAVAVDFGDSDHFTVLVDGHGETSPAHGTHDAPDVRLRTDVLGLWSLFDGSVPADDLEQAGRLTVDGSPAARGKVLSAIAARDARSSFGLDRSAL